MPENEFKPLNERKNYEDVLQQQGRVQTDNDFNEEEAIEHHNIFNLADAVKRSIDGITKHTKLVLLHGADATQKNESAAQLAQELNKPLLTVNLSSLISKYIGETEINIEKVFAEAITGNAVLLFDEADALFGKRTGVQDAHDRYANAETNYLLRKIEEHLLPVIISVNDDEPPYNKIFKRYHYLRFPFTKDE